MRFKKQTFILLFLPLIISLWGCKSNGQPSHPQLPKPEPTDSLKLVPYGGTLVSLRDLPTHKWKEQKGTYKFVAKNLDMSYGGDQFFNTNVAFPEFYIDWEEGEMETDPTKNRMVQDIKNKWEAHGKELYGFKISREFMVGRPPGPFPYLKRVLYKSDIIAIRKVLKKAKEAGLIKRDDYKLIQMINPPMAPAKDTKMHSVVSTNKKIQETLLMMDGVAEEIHHFWHYSNARPDVDDLTKKDVAATVKDAKWVLEHNLEFVFYYGPYEWKDCKNYSYDMFRGWLERFWKAGLPKYHENMIYDLNAFPHACGGNRPIAPESDPQSVAGITKWLIEQVKFKLE